MTRYKLIIEYDGTDYCGWQRQADDFASVQHELEKAIFSFSGQNVNIHGAGRTDSGVHARGQVAHIDLDLKNTMSPFDITKAINAHLKGKKIAVIECEKVSSDFHARFSAMGKLYSYTILNRPSPPTLDINKVWYIRRKLDDKKMHVAAQIFVGTHDFSSFRDAQCQAKSPIKTLTKMTVERQGDFVTIHAEGQSFLHHQVRNMVGSLVLVGHNKWEIEDIQSALDAKDRAKAGPTSPPDGLCLVRIDY